MTGLVRAICGKVGVCLWLYSFLGLVYASVINVNWYKIYSRTWLNILELDWNINKLTQINHKCLTNIHRFMQGIGSNVCWNLTIWRHEELILNFNWHSCI